MGMVKGELTQQSVPRLLDNCAYLLDGSVVDLSQVTRTDSAGLAFLLELKRRAAKEGHELKLAGIPPQVTELARFFAVAPLLGIA